MDFSALGGGAAVAATNNAGVWTASYNVTAGTTDTTGVVSVTATDNAGNITTTADTLTLTVDNQAPTVTDAKIALSSATGSGTGGAYIVGDTVTATWNNTASGDNNTDTISGVTMDFSAFGGGAAVAATNDGNGNWSASYTIASGTQNGVTANVSVTATDNAGNTTTVADTTGPTVDNQVPTQTVGSIAISSDTGSSTSDFITKTAAQTITGTLSGTLGAGEILYGSTDGGATWTDITAKVTGTAISWNGATLASGANSIRFKVTDATGNDGTIATRSYTLDTVAPSAATVTALTTNSSQPTITGTFDSSALTSGGSFKLSGIGNGNLTLGDTGFTSSGNTWTLDLATFTNAGNPTGITLADGGYDFTATTTDAAGNIKTDNLNNPNGLGYVFVDTTAPAAPTVNALTSESTTPVITGSAALATASGTVTAETMTVSVGGATYNVTPSGGTWSLDLATATPVSGTLDLTALGTHQVVATVTDAAGNATSDTTTGEISIVDLTAPTAPAIIAPAAGATLTSSTATITGTGEAGATLKVYDTDGTTLLGTTTVGASGAWSLANVSLSSGDHTLHAHQTDPSGNQSAEQTLALNVSSVNPSILAQAAATTLTTGTTFTGPTSGSIGTVGAGTPLINAVQRSVAETASQITSLSDLASQTTTPTGLETAASGGQTAEGRLASALNTPSGAGRERPGQAQAGGRANLPSRQGVAEVLNVAPSLLGQVRQLSPDSFEILLPSSSLPIGDTIFTATSPDGKPLPDYIEIDPVSGKVTIHRDKAPLGVTNVSIKVSRVVQNGSQKDVKSASFELTITKEAKAKLGGNEPQRTPNSGA